MAIFVILLIIVLFLTVSEISILVFVSLRLRFLEIVDLSGWSSTIKYLSGKLERISTVPKYLSRLGTSNSNGVGIWNKINFYIGINRVADDGTNFVQISKRRYIVNVPSVFILIGLRDRNANIVFRKTLSECFFDSTNCIDSIDSYEC